MIAHNFNLVSEPATQCAGKERFRHRRGAIRAAQAVARRRRNVRYGKRRREPNCVVDAYQCPHCGDWHIGNHLPRRRAA